MSKYRFHLQKYSLGSKIACPSCERPRCFVKYVDEEGVVSFSNEVGKCDHEISCGYHYTPRDFFRDNPNANIKEERSSDYVQPVKSTHEKEIIVPPSFIPLEYFNASLAHFEKNPLYKYLCRVFGEAEAQRVFHLYHVGTSAKWGGATVFWQIDANEQVRSGKIILYNSETGHRVKEPHSYVSWAHRELQLKDFNLKQCLFGEHLLIRYPDAPVILVESEKTAIVMSHFIPNYVWVATGGINGCFKEEFVHSLKGRDVTLIPDLGATQLWKEKSQFIEMYYNTHNKQTLESVCPIMNKGITPKYVESSSVLVINQACIHWDGQRLGNIKYHNEEIPVRKRILESGDVLLNATGNGTLGRCCVFICPSDNNTYINDGHVIALSTDRAVILPEVLNTYLSLNDTQAEIYRQYVTGSTNQVDIVFSDIKKMKVPVPSMDEQILFVEVLTQADKSEFVGCKSQFIEIFYGMETTPVKDYIDDSFPGEWGTEDKDGNGVKVIRTTNFTNSGKLNLADVVTRSIEDRKVVRKQIKKYDTILERSGGTADNPVGRVVLFEEDNLFLCNNFTQVLRFKDVDPRFAFYALYYFYQTNRTAIRSMGSKTTGIQNLNMSKYLEIGIPNASDEDQKAFVTIAEQADKSEYYN